MPTDTHPDGSTLPPAQQVSTALDTCHWLTELTTLNYSDAFFQERLFDGRLAQLYAALQTHQLNLQHLQTFVQDTPLISLVKSASDNVKKLLGDIQTFYTNAINQSWFGDFSATQPPDAIVILSANQPTLDQRLAYALPIVQQFKEAPVVLSGGGRTNRRDAELMQSYLTRHHVAATRLLKESDSLDTIGNAVFSAFVLAEHGIHAGRVLLITSSFHALRSLFLFRTILGQSFKVAVAAECSPQTNLSLFVHHELEQTATAIHEILHWPILPEHTHTSLHTTPRDIFIRTLLRHPRYHSRWDLASRHAVTTAPFQNEATPS